MRAVLLTKGIGGKLVSLISAYVSTKLFFFHSLYEHIIILIFCILHEQFFRAFEYYLDQQMFAHNIDIYVVFFQYVYSYGLWDKLLWQRLYCKLGICKALNVLLNGYSYAFSDYRSHTFFHKLYKVVCYGLFLHEPSKHVQNYKLSRIVRRSMCLKSIIFFKSLVFILFFGMNIILSNLLPNDELVVYVCTIHLD